MKTYNPFWKKPIDVHNKVQTRAQLKKRQKRAQIIKQDIINGYNSFQKTVLL